jgi:hypothetical protein
MADGTRAEQLHRPPVNSTLKSRIPMKKVTLKYIINLVDGIAATSLRVHTCTVGADELNAARSRNDHNIMEGELCAELLFNTVTISLSVVGDPNKSGSFNLFAGEQKVFSEDQTFTTKGTGRVDFTKHNVSLPI